MSFLLCICITSTSSRHTLCRNSHSQDKWQLEPLCLDGPEERPNTAKEGQKSAGSGSLAEIPLKHYPNLGQNLSKIHVRHSPSEFSVSDEGLNMALGLCSCWGPHGFSACLSACLLSLYARETSLSAEISIPEKGFAMLKRIRGKRAQTAMLGSSTWKDHSPYS